MADEKTPEKAPEKAPQEAVHPPEGATERRWVAPFAALDRMWTNLDAKLCLAVIVAEIIALWTWISFKGLKSLPGDIKGVIYRVLVTAVLFALIAHLVMRFRARAQQKKAGSKAIPPSSTHAIVVTSALVVGALAGRAWVGVGATYFENVFNWFQEGSVLYLVGGIKGLVTRLTFWLALLGGSLATSKGKHISIDVLLRFLPKKMLAPVAIVTWLAASGMCFGAALGFSDFLAMTQFDSVHPGHPDPKHPSGLRSEPCAFAPSKLCDPPAGDKARGVLTWMRTDLFVLGRQITLDVRTLPRVLAGQKWDDYLTVPQWNDWIRGADWQSEFGKDRADGFIRPDGPTKMEPVVPRIAAKEGQLIRDLSFVFPVGFVMIGLRFLLRILLVLGGRIKLDPDAAHLDEDVKASGDEDPDGTSEAQPRRGQHQDAALAESQGAT